MLASRRFENDAALLPRTLTIHLQHAATGRHWRRERSREGWADGRHFATNTRRRRGWFIRGTVFASSLLETLCAATNREDLQEGGGRVAEIASLFFFSPFLFSNDHFPRELSFLHSCGTSIAVSNTSIGRTEISGGTYVFFTFPPWKGKGGVLSSSFFQFHRGSVR